MAEAEKHICKVSFYEIDAIDLPYVQVDVLIAKAMEGYSTALIKADEKGLVIKKASFYKDMFGMEYVFTFELDKPNPFAFMSGKKDYVSEEDFYNFLKKQSKISF